MLTMRCDLCGSGLRCESFADGDCIKHDHGDLFLVMLRSRSMELCEACQKRLHDSLVSTVRGLRRTQPKVVEV